MLRGALGFYGAHEPFRDRFLALRRNVPVHAVVLDTPNRVRDWWPVLDEVTSQSGPVTSEPVPASHAKSAEAERGGFRRTAIHRLLTEDAPSD